MFLSSLLLFSLFTSTLAAPRLQTSSGAHLPGPLLVKRDDFAEWGVGADWNIRDAGNFFATFDNGVKFALQNDGNFVIYDANSKVLWASNTAGHSCSSGSNGNCLLTFQGDGNFVLYVNNSPVWSTKTQNKGVSLLLQDTKPYISVYNAAVNYVYSSGGRPPVPDEREPGGAAGGGGGGLGTLCKVRFLSCLVFSAHRKA